MAWRLVKLGLALLLTLSTTWMHADNSKGSLDLGVSAAKRYLSVDVGASVDFEDSAISSLNLSYVNSRSGDPGDMLKSWQAGIGVDKQGKIFNGSLGFSLSGDDIDRKNSGARLGLGATWEYVPGYDVSLGLSGGWDRFSASVAPEDLSPTGGALAQRRARVNNTLSITQYNPGAELSLGFLDGKFSAWGAFSVYRFQDYVAGSGLAGTADKNAAAANLEDALESGFNDWEWSLGATLKTFWGLTLVGSYCEVLDLDAQSWSKSVSGTLSKKIGQGFKALAGITHATEGGSGENTFKVGLTYYF